MRNALAKFLTITMVVLLAGISVLAVGVDAQGYAPSPPTFDQGLSGAEILAQIQANAAAAAQASADAAAAASVPAAAASGDAVALAFTGADVNLPIALGAALVGSGGLVLLAANKRSRRES